MYKVSSKIIAVALCLSVFLAGCTSPTPSSTTDIPPASTEVSQVSDDGYLVYENAKHKYAFTYPADLSTTTESETGDGATFSDGYGNELKVWATQNVETKTTKAYLDEIKLRVTSVVDSYIDDYSYEINYKESSTSSAEGEFHFFEAGFINNGMTIHFLFTYDARFSEEYKSTCRYMSEQLKEKNKVE